MINYVNFNSIKNYYDFILVGAGLFNAVCARELIDNGYSCLVIDKRLTIGGNCYTEWNDTVKCHEHVYGAHIFRTSNKEVWEYVNKFTEFNNFINSPIANYKGEIYSMPFNMYTFSKLFNVSTPDQAKEAIKNDIVKYDNPSNLEEHVLSIVGKKIYNTLVKEYTEKQWGRDCKDLPASIIKRLPLRYTYNNNYFNDKYQGIPINGYTDMITKMFDGCDMLLNIDYCENKEFFNSLCNRVIYTGRIDEYYNYCFGKLEYRSLRFEDELLEKDDYQGNAVVNYTSHDEKFTRIIEHKHFDKTGNVSNKFTLITKEYPVESGTDNEAYYPINNGRNNSLYNKYRELVNSDKNPVYIEGRLGRYEYNDMDDTVKNALDFIKGVI